ncbi:MAG: hypothetical protein EZS28_039109, partial [Streblomastix strix]
ESDTEDGRKVEIIDHQLCVIQSNEVRLFDNKIIIDLLPDQPYDVHQFNPASENQEKRCPAVVLKHVRVDALKLKNKPATIELPGCFAHPNFCLIFQIVYRVPV